MAPSEPSYRCDNPAGLIHLSASSSLVTVIRFSLRLQNLTKICNFAKVGLS
jgi:hypothetical protein